MENKLYRSHKCAVVCIILVLLILLSLFGFHIYGIRNYDQIRAEGWNLTDEEVWKKKSRLCYEKYTPENPWYVGNPAYKLKDFSLCYDYWAVDAQQMVIYQPSKSFDKHRNMYCHRNFRFPNVATASIEKIEFIEIPGGATKPAPIITAHSQIEEFRNKALAWEVRFFKQVDSIDPWVYGPETKEEWCAGIEALSAFNPQVNTTGDSCKKWQIRIYFQDAENLYYQPRATMYLESDGNYYLGLNAVYPSDRSNISQQDYELIRTVPLIELSEELNETLNQVFK